MSTVVVKRAESRARKITEMVEMLAPGETLYPQKAAYLTASGCTPRSQHPIHERETGRRSRLGP